MRLFQRYFTVSTVLISLILTSCQINAPTIISTPELSTTAPTLTPIQNHINPTPAITATLTATPNAEEEPVNFQGALIDGVDWYVLIQDASTNQTIFELNPNTPFPPASMIKVPTALAVLSILEDQGRTLDDLKAYGISGRNFNSLLEAMIVRSEESATDALEYFARGGNQLRIKLDSWGLTNTKYDPRVSTATELLTSLRLLNTNTVLTAENSQFLLTLMGTYTENDHILLGKLTEALPDCVFLNKRGTMLRPTIASDMGILSCGEHSWYLVVAGTPAADSTATFEDIQASIETFALTFAQFVRQQLTQP